MAAFNMLCWPPQRHKLVAKSVIKSKQKQKNEMLIRHVTTSLSLRNYLSLPERHAKGYMKYFSRIQWSSESSVYLIAFCTNEKN
jgi:hypothetical protein